MRTFRLARVAADAELLRLRLRARRAAVRAILALVALGFLAGAAVFCHLALWYWLRHYFEPPQSALILAGIDVVLAIILVLLAARSTPSRTELEALDVRHRAVEGITASLAFSALAMQLLRLATQFVRRPRT
jgi:hypothetical protein